MIIEHQDLMTFGKMGKYYILEESRFVSGHVELEVWLIQAEISSDI